MKSEIQCEVNAAFDFAETSDFPKSQNLPKHLYGKDLTKLYLSQKQLMKL